MKHTWQVGDQVSCPAYIWKQDNHAFAKALAKEHGGNFRSVRAFGVVHALPRNQTQLDVYFASHFEGEPAWVCLVAKQDLTLEKLAPKRGRGRPRSEGSRKKPSPR